METQNQQEVKNTAPCNALEKDLVEQSSQIELMGGFEAVRLVRRNLDSCILRMNNRSAEIISMIMAKATSSDLKMFVTQEIERVAEGNIATPNFKVNTKHDQELLLYVGTHWVVIPPDCYKEFVKSSAKAIGLPEKYYEDPYFMRSLMDHVAYRFLKAVHAKKQRDKAFINLQNGTLALSKNGDVELLSHQRDDGFRYVLPYVYDPAATCEKWQATLDKILPEEEARDLLSEYFGFCLTDGIKVEKMLAFHGRGGNGKSVVMETMEALFGEENTSSVSLSSLTNDDKKRAMINEKRVNISYESGTDVESDMLKRIISGEPIEAYINYFGPIIMRRYAKQVVSFNRLPKAEKSYAFFRRIILMPFNVTISEEEKNVNLAKEIIAEELPGIFNWMLQGLRRFLQKYEFTRSPLCEKALEKYRMQTDSVLCFAKTSCKVSSSKMLGQELHNHYKEFCNREDFFPVGRRKFYDEMHALGYIVTENRRIKYVEAEIIPIDEAV